MHATAPRGSRATSNAALTAAAATILLVDAAAPSASGSAAAEADLAAALTGPAAPALLAYPRTRDPYVTTVHPGGIRTRIAETARAAAVLSPRHVASGRRAAARLLTYPPERAAADILRAVERRQARLVITWLAVVLDVLARLLPVGHARLISPLRAWGPRRRRAA